MFFFEKYFSQHDKSSLKKNKNCTSPILMKNQIIIDWEII
jgi:hypothetical protein